MTQQPPITPTSRTVVTRVKHHVTLDNGFDLYVYTGSDGATVVEVESHGSDDTPFTHSRRNEPVARV